MSTARPGDAWTPEAWDAAYYEAMRWRDWQTCDQLLAERKRESWYVETPNEQVLEALRDAE